jgi:adenosylhomocysteine nucleosidase
MPSSEASDDLTCDLLLFFATTTEKEQLKSTARELGLPFQRRSDSRLGRHYRLGMVGDFRVIAVQTLMGPLGFQGSASQGIYFRSRTAATAIVQLGMALGVSPTHQKYGDVLVSSSIIPYDRRDIRPAGDSYRIDYSPAKRQPAKASMIELFLKESQRSERPFQVHTGAMLSGGTAIFCRKFRDELVAAIPAMDEPIIGGEMEGVGLLSISPPDDPAWIVVKGISDFADEDRDAIIKETRPLACGNSAKFVLSALLNAKQP